MEAPQVRGYLVLTVEEASGKTQKDSFCWDTTSTSGPFEAFAKIEVRGATKNVKASTKKVGLVGDTLTWQEELRLEVLDDASELRIMLCRDKITQGKRGTAVIAACGIYVSDILDAVPIDKYFELFKPNAGGEGGYIRISMNFVTDLPERKVAAPSGSSAVAEVVPKPAGASSKSTQAGKLLRVVAVLSVVAALAGAITEGIIKSQKGKK